MEGTLDVSGACVSNNLNVKSVVVTDTTTLKGKLDAQDASFNNNVDVSGNLNVEGILDVSGAWM